MIAANSLMYVMLSVMGVILCALVLMHVGVLGWIGKGVHWLARSMGGRAYEVEQQLIRAKSLNSKGLVAKYYRWANSVLVNQGLLIKGITVTGFTVYNIVIAFLITLVVSFMYSLSTLLFVFCFGLVLTVLYIFNTLRSASYLERREALIMDTLDLIVPLVHNGVKNAITSLLPSIHPLLRSEFESFISAVRDKVSFADAMTLLSHSLGNSFSSFAQKAILYERDAEDGMLEIFSNILEDNQSKRILRRENNEIFTELRIQLLISLAIIAAFTFWLVNMDPFMKDFLFYSDLGKFMVLGNVAVVVYAFGYITLIKAQEFD